jgi:hypothetical protein
VGERDGHRWGRVSNEGGPAAGGEAKHKATLHSRSSQPLSYWLEVAGKVAGKTITPAIPGRSNVKPPLVRISGISVSGAGSASKGAEVSHACSWRWYWAMAADMVVELLLLLPGW